MVTGEGQEPEPVRILHESSVGSLEGIMAFTHSGQGGRMEVECSEDSAIRAIEVDPVQFCHQMAQHFPGVGIDLVFIDHEPHPLTHAGAKHALEVTGDLTWHMLSQPRDVVRESIRRLRRMLTAPGTEEDPYFRVSWASGTITSHPKAVQDQLEQGNNVYANNELPEGIPQLVDMILPLSAEGGSMAPVLAEAPERTLRLFVADPIWLKPIIAQMELQGRSVVKFWVVAPGDGGIELLGPA